ncbi:MAG TPA: tetratricopeptide repeat protein [Planctomycetota bacterium]|nr:tetratricopeptide repeat protein [Planctomycetota bacterium]
MFAALLLALVPQSPQSPQMVTDIQARIPKTFFVVSLALTDWKEQAGDPMGLGDKLVFAGTLAPAGSILTVIAELNEPQVSPKTWRERLAPPGKLFDVEFTPCVDSTSELAPGMVQSDYHAYFATRTHALDLHISRLGDKQEGFPREEFERIVKSLRILLLRRGWAEDYPESIQVPMTMASILGVDQKQWKESYLPKHAEEWPAHFASAEFLHNLESPFEEQLAAYDKALALIAKVEQPDKKTRYATAILHEGRSFAFYDAKKFEDSIPPLQQSLAILTELGSKDRAGIAYNLACSQALTRHRDEALAALKQAIEVDPRYRQKAADDSDFASLAEDAEFKKLIAQPAPKTPPKKP